MPIRDLREKYGRNLKTRQAVNRAIAAELVAGEDVLNALTLLSRAEIRLGEHRLPTDRAHAAVNATLALRDELGDEIARRYGMATKEV